MKWQLFGFCVLWRVWLDIICSLIISEKFFYVITVCPVFCFILYHHWAKHLRYCCLIYYTCERFFDLGSSVYVKWTIVMIFDLQIVHLSATSTLTTHPQPLDTRMLNNSDLLIFTGLTQAPTYNPDSMVSELCTCIGKKNSWLWW